jgi:hypothetical protein
MNRLFSIIFVCICFCTRLSAISDTTIIAFPKDFTMTSTNNDDVFGDPDITGKPSVLSTFGCANPSMTYKDSFVNSTIYCKHWIRTWTVKHTCTTSINIQKKKQNIYLIDTTMPTIKGVPKIDVAFSDSNTYVLKLNKIDAKDISGIKSVEVRLLQNGSMLPLQVKYSLPNTMVIPPSFAGKTLSLQYIVQDSCGNYILKDATAFIPTKSLYVTCKNNVVKEFSSTGKVIVNANEFLNQIYENNQSTSDAILKFEIVNPNLSCFQNSPSSTLKLVDTLKCLGVWGIKLWAKSKTGGDLTFCLSSLNLQNTKKIPNIQVCAPVNVVPIDICLEVKTSKGQPINVLVDYEGIESKPNNGFNCIKTSDCYQNLWLNFDKKDTPTNGVTTLDLVLISKHILGIQPITSPSGLLAADVNRDGKISTADLVELRKVILGLKPVFSDGKTWHFYDENYKPSPMIMMTEFKSISKKIMAVKIGDVDGSATPN